MRFQEKYIFNIVFGLAAFTLLLNDFFLKDEFHNAVTGKLSDITGLAAFFLALRTLVPRTHAVLFSFLVFASWNSVLSTPLIEMCKSWGMPLHRTVDPLDNLALIVLIPLWFYNPKTLGLKFHPPRSHSSSLTLLTGIFILFTFCQTTCHRYYRLWAYEGIELESDFNVKHTGTEEGLWKQIQWGLGDAKLRRDSIGEGKDLHIIYMVDSLPLDSNCLIQGLVKFNLLYSAKKKVPRLKMDDFYFLPDSTYYQKIQPRSEDLSGICQTCVHDRIRRTIGSLVY